MSGIHHITAVAGKPSRNLDFYTRILGMRLVKKTVNFDDPDTYHLYYGDSIGRPGTILTFFPWENALAGRNGLGLVHETSLLIPAGSLGYWTQRFIQYGVAHVTPEKRFGDTVLALSDPDGLSLALVGSDSFKTDDAWTNGSVPVEHSIRGFHGATLLLAQAAPTAEILTNVLGFKLMERQNSLSRFHSLSNDPGRNIDIREAGDFLKGSMGTGSVHHIAFRAQDDEEQMRMADRLRTDHGIHPTRQIDRQYFRSIYFHEPGGILFEIATDQPGFTVDEQAATLGADLKLPAFLEPRRRDIESSLPSLSKAE